MAVKEGWELVIGLEVHAELRTVTKLFCACRNQFGEEANTNICPVCLGLPGSLPVLNEQVVELAIRVGLALHSDVRGSQFHRKNYFYPDMPKDYQISQYDAPINSGGWLDLPDGSRIGIVRSHIEEDTGKTSHVGSGGRIHSAEYSLVDYNRAGVPLLEIVSEPDIRSADQARAYVGELRSILVATGASDGKMEEGSMRVDANVSVRRSGEPLGTRCEIKNLNSLRSLGRAVEYEANRQIGLIEAGEKVVQETRHWDEEAGRTSSMRSKEEAMDYRYFPEPDLVPLRPSAEWVEKVSRALPSLPAERRATLAAATGGELGPGADPIVTIVDQGLDVLVLDAVRLGADARRAINRAANEVAGAAPEQIRSLGAEPFASLLRLEGDGALTPTQAKQVLATLLESGGDPVAIARERGFEAMSSDSLGAVVDEAIAAHPAEWQRYLDGDGKVTGFFVGLVMKATAKKADGNAVTALLKERAGR